jgi:hypothetical protein
MLPVPVRVPLIIALVLAGFVVGLLAAGIIFEQIRRRSSLDRAVRETANHPWNNNPTTPASALHDLLQTGRSEPEPLENLTAYFKQRPRPSEWFPQWLLNAIFEPIILASFVVPFFFLWLICERIWRPYVAALDLVTIYVLHRFWFADSMRTGRQRLKAFLLGAQISPARHRTGTLMDLATIWIAIAVAIVFLRNTASAFRMLDALYDRNDYSVDFGPLVTQHYVGIIALAVAYGATRLWFEDRNLGMAAPAEMVPIRRLDELEFLTTTSPPSVICHLTDLHLTSPRDRKADSPAGREERKTISGEGGKNWLNLNALLLAHADDIRRASAALVTGDITDTAAPAEWKGFFDAFEHAPDLKAKLIILPGNHDVNLCHVWKSDNPDLIQRKLNMIRFLTAVDQIQGDRTWILPDHGGKILFRDWAAQYSHSFRSFLRQPPFRTYRYLNTGNGQVTAVENTPPETLALMVLPDLAWYNAFPMIAKTDLEGPWYLLFDSNLPGSNIFTNAFGWVSPAQLQRARRFLEEHSGDRVVIALHHHMGNPEAVIGDFRARLMDRALTLENGYEFTSALPASRIYPVFNGHRHIRYIGQIDHRLIAVARPSTTMGNALQKDGPRPPGFGRYELYWDELNNLSGIREMLLSVDTPCTLGTPGRQSPWWQRCLEWFQRCKFPAV